MFQNDILGICYSLQKAFFKQFVDPNTGIITDLQNIPGQTLYLLQPDPSGIYYPDVTYYSKAQ